MRRIIFLTFAAMCCLAAHIHAGEKTRILLIGKNNDHPYGTHEYMITCKLLAKCLQQTPNIETIVSNGWPTNPNKLKGVKAIVLYTANGGDVLLHPRVRKQALKLLKSGVGLTAVHWSTGANDINGPQWQMILGGWFSRKFAGSRLYINKAKLQQAAPDHPICNGWKPYPLHDEYYFDLKFEPSAKPVMKVTVKDKDYTVGWVYKRPGTKDGRSFGFVCGHYFRNFGETPFRQAVSNGILWTAHLDVPPGGAACAIARTDMKLPPRKKKK